MKSTTDVKVTDTLSVAFLGVENRIGMSLAVKQIGHQYKIVTKEMIE
jgi:hypothetical protein